MKHLYLFFPCLLFCIGTTVSQTPDDYPEHLSRIKQKINQVNHLPELKEKKDAKKALSPQQTKEWDYGDAPDWAWSKDIGGSGNDFIKDVVTDTDGNYYIAGSFSGEISYGDKTYESTGLRDGFVAKLDNEDNLEWFNHFEADNHEKVNLNAIHIDGSGNVYTTGHFSAGVSVGDYSLSGDNRKNLLYVKTDNNGNALHVGSHDTGEANEVGKDILTDADNNLYVLGGHYILKYDENFDLLWEMQEEETFNDFEIVDNNLYYVGYVWKAQGEIGDATYTTDTDNDSYGDFFLARSDLDGNFDFVELPMHTGDQHYYLPASEAFQLSSDINNNVYLTGWYEHDLVLEEDTLEGSSNQGFLAKFNSGGTAQWGINLDFEDQQQFPLSTADNGVSYIAYSDKTWKYDANGDLSVINESLGYKPQALQVDKNTDKLITAGTKEGGGYKSVLNSSLEEDNLINFGHNSGKVCFTGMVSDDEDNIYVCGNAVHSINYHGETISDAAFFAKHDPSGDLIWLKSIENANLEMHLGDDINVDPQNEYLYIAGEFHETIDIPGGETLNPGSNGSTFLLKYDIDGNFEWSYKNDDILPNSLDLTTDYSGNVILSNIFGTTIQVDGETYESFGGQDIIIIKLNSAGDIQWSKQAGGESNEYFGLTSADENDNIYFTGEFLSENIEIGNSSATLEDGDGNIVFAKLNPDGAV